MTCLVVGATGATGRLLVRELLARGTPVRAVVRSRSGLDDEVLADPGLSVVEAGIAGLPDADVRDLVQGCDAAASCLGHRLSLRGIYGPPRDSGTDLRLDSDVQARSSIPIYAEIFEPGCP